MSDKNNFLRASKKKLRFKSSKGVIGVEDLWDLSLENLDTLAVAVNKEIQSSSGESFIGKQTRASSDNILRLDLLKEVIALKLAEKEARVQRADNKAREETLKALLEQKKIEKLAGMSEAEIAAELEKLQD